MSKEIEKSEVIDSRDVIERIGDLESDLEDLYDEYAEATPNHAAFETWLRAAAIDRECDYQDDAIELMELQAFAQSAQNYSPDWEYGSTLIREDYFVEYCKELLADIGDIPREIPDYIVIDWEATSENLKVDYTEVDFGGVTYYVR